MPADLHQRVKQAAKRRGKSVNGLIVDTLAREFEELPADSNRADIALAKYIGSVSSEGCDDVYDSKRAGEYFTEGLIQKQKEGHL
jgi:hypothetical protein